MGGEKRKKEGGSSGHEEEKVVMGVMGDGHRRTRLVLVAC